MVIKLVMLGLYLDSNKVSMMIERDDTLVAGLGDDDDNGVDVIMVIPILVSAAMIKRKMMIYCTIAINSTPNNMGVDQVQTASHELSSKAGTGTAPSSEARCFF